MKIIKNGFLIILLLFSCKAEKQAHFSTQEIVTITYESGKTAAKGFLNFSRPQILEYHFESNLSIPPNSSLVIEYTFSLSPSEEIRENYKLTLETETDTWTLPMDLLFLGITISCDAVIHYAIPIEDSFNGHFRIMLTAIGTDTVTELNSVLEILSIQFINQWFGFNKIDNKYYTSPFVSGNKGESFLISLPSIKDEKQTKEFQLTVSELSAGQTAEIELNGKRITAFPAADRIIIPSCFIPPEPVITLRGEGITSFYLSHFKRPNFPVPIKADPALVLYWPRNKWRRSNWEIFRWDSFPSLLIMDTANYDVQNRFLKRLAFFVEKTGFRGELSHDDDIADLHGWNAHDYRAEDLARFFDTARKTNFPLLAEERLLENVLLNEGIIRRMGTDIVAGIGGIISISRQAAPALRYRFMAHEAFHGLFFIDEEFRNFTRSRWEIFCQQARTFLLAFLDFKEYDTGDEFLVLKEFKSYLLQKPISEMELYFGRTLPLSLENTEFDYALPPKNTSTGTWPTLASVFIAEAEVFSAYVKERWGFEAGRAWHLLIN
jgi:hypothetical protein